MRTMFVFAAGERAEIIAALDRHLNQQRHPWTLDDGNLYIDIDEEQNGCLLSDWEPDDVTVLDRAAGFHPTWAVQIDISGRVDGTAEVVALPVQQGRRQRGVRWGGYWAT
ncbi:hypothetical protein [Streptomyces sp. 840.1]|uniref:hypothetical protein n=1 Tax=Streptomyces sp. 840.1 TaxID=2485152 RepID=UPI0011CE58F8|nr:hypothetical protein [Streptomyces sp. 840.1]